MRAAPSQVWDVDGTLRDEELEHVIRFKTRSGTVLEFDFPQQVFRRQAIQEAPGLWQRFYGFELPVLGEPLRFSLDASSSEWVVSTPVAAAERLAEHQRDRFRPASERLLEEAAVTVTALALDLQRLAESPEIYTVDPHHTFVRWALADGELAHRLRQLLPPVGCWPAVEIGSPLGRHVIVSGELDSLKLLCLGGRIGARWGLPIGSGLSAVCDFVNQFLKGEDPNGLLVPVDRATWR